MSFLKLIFTAQNLINQKKILVDEKETSISYEKSHKKSFKFRWVKYKCVKKFKNFFSCCCCRKFCFSLKHFGSLENYVLKCFLGFFGGLILTYTLFIILVFQLNIRISLATIICSVIGCVLVLGLAFSSKIRCIVLLTMPHFFSKKGRQLLIGYALALVLAGPAQNILNNLGILSESLTCGQEQLKSALKQIFEVIKKPFYAIKDAIKKVIATVKDIIKKIKEILIKIKRIIMAIIKVIKNIFMFLMKIMNVCNKELGTPFERCTRVFESAVSDCNAKLGVMFGWLCSITYIVQSVCYIVKVFDFVCAIVDLISNSFIGVVIRKVKSFIRHIRTMFYTKIKFSHSFHFESKASKSILQIAKDIHDEIIQRIQGITVLFQLTLVTASIFVILMIIKVLLYRYKFLVNDSFDNKYLTEDFFQLEFRRAKHGRETLLPLNNKESKFYVRLLSTKLTDVESKHLKKSVMNLLVVSMKCCIYMGCDFALFWIMEIINYYGKFQSKVQAPNLPLPHISGKGLLVDLLSSIIKAFQPMGLTLEIDTVPCLPTPIPPNLDTYVQIVTLLLLCWTLTILEPYGLRFRIFIMTYYHPTRGKQRAIWLYNKILRKRSSFLKFARRQLRKKVLGSEAFEGITCKEYLLANFSIFGYCFDQSKSNCLLCGTVLKKNNGIEFIKCITPGCPGIYCDQCFADLKNLCTVCLSPIEYGDFSNLSEEKDSSEEELVKKEEVSKKLKGWKNLLLCCRPKQLKKILSEEIPLTTNHDNLNDSKDTLQNKSVESGDENNDQMEDNSSLKDSGNVSSVSSDYSFSYQYIKEDLNIQLPEITQNDIEKQEVYDYASMDSFRENKDINKKNKIKSTAKKISTFSLKQSKYSQVTENESKSESGSYRIIKCPYFSSKKQDDGTSTSGRHINYQEKNVLYEKKPKFTKKVKTRETYNTTDKSSSSSDEG